MKKTGDEEEMAKLILAPGRLHLMQGAEMKKMNKIKKVKKY